VPGGDRREGDDVLRGTVSVRAHLSRALLLVLVLGLLPSVLAIHYLRTLESTSSVAAASTPSPRVEAGSLPGDTDPGGGATSDLDARRPVAMTAADRATRNAITFAILAAAAGVLVVVYTPAALLGALGKVTAILQQAESGNLNVAVAGSRVREVSTLAIAVNRTLGRLRHFDTLKTQRIREEQRLSEALLAASDRAMALVGPEASIARANAAFRSLVEANDEECDGRPVREVLGDEAHDAVRRVQRERDPASIEWSDGEAAGAFRIRLSPVKDEVEAPPRVLLAFGPAGETADPPGAPDEDEET
jgi:PAS domain-containing protein